jgi:hypothetical protein
MPCTVSPGHNQAFMSSGLQSLWVLVPAWLLLRLPPYALHDGKLHIPAHFQDLAQVSPNSFEILAILAE